MSNNSSKDDRSGAPGLIGGVVFDFDGTLTKPGLIDFAKIKRDTGCPPDMGLLEYIPTIGHPYVRHDVEAALEAAEWWSADHAEWREGARETIEFLREHETPMAIISRNLGVTVKRALDTLEGVSVDDFVTIVTRDIPVRFKPDPASVLYAAEKMGIDVERLLVIGDNEYDIIAGNAAGAKTLLLRGVNGDPDWELQADYVVDSFAEALRIISDGM